jgi:hypothetical protein
MLRSKKLPIIVGLVALAVAVIGWTFGGAIAERTNDNNNVGLSSSKLGF